MKYGHISIEFNKILGQAYVEVTGTHNGCNFTHQLTVLIDKYEDYKNIEKAIQNILPSKNMVNLRKLIELTLIGYMSQWVNYKLFRIESEYKSIDLYDDSGYTIEDAELFIKFTDPTTWDTRYI